MSALSRGRSPPPPVPPQWTDRLQCDMPPGVPEPPVGIISRAWSHTLTHTANSGTCPHQAWLTDTADQPWAQQLVASLMQCVLAGRAAWKTFAPSCNHLLYSSNPSAVQRLAGAAAPSRRAHCASWPKVAASLEYCMGIETPHAAPCERSACTTTGTQYRKEWQQTDCVLTAAQQHTEVLSCRAH